MSKQLYTLKSILSFLLSESSVNRAQAGERPNFRPRANFRRLPQVPLHLIQPSFFFPAPSFSHYQPCLPPSYPQSSKFLLRHSSTSRPRRSSRRNSPPASRSVESSPQPVRASSEDRSRTWRFGSRTGMKSTWRRSRIRAAAPILGACPRPVSLCAVTHLPVGPQHCPCSLDGDLWKVKIAF